MDALQSSSRSHSALVLSALVLLLSLALSAAAWYGTLRDIREDARQLFRQQAALVASEVQRRIDQPVYGLKGARGMYASSAPIGREAFRAYVESRNLPVEFPGVRGFGFIQRVERTELANFIAAERRDNAPDFSVRTQEGLPDLYVIKYIDPLQNNRAAWGLDLGSEPMRRQAVERAIGTGQASLSSRITLVQDGTQGPGFLYLLPVYRSGEAVATARQRQDALLGLVYSPIVVAEILRGTTDISSRQIDFDLFDGELAEPAHRIFDSRSLVPAVATPAAAPVASISRNGPLFSATQALKIGGRTLTLQAASSAQFDAALDDSTPWLVGGGGVLLSAVLAWSVWLLATGRERAIALARSMTSDLDRLASVVQHTSNAVILTDTQQRITWTNEGFTRTYGYTLEEAVGRDPMELLGRRGDEADMQRLRSAMAAGQGCRLEVVNRTKEGRDCWTDLDLQPRRGAQGALTGFMEIGLDVTTQRATDAELRRSNTVMQSIIDNLPCGLSVFDGDLHLTAHNREFRRLLDLPDALFERQPIAFESLIRYSAGCGDYGDGPVDDIVSQVIERARLPVVQQFERTRPNGIPLEILRAPLPDGGLVTTYVDISERKKVERLKNEFISTVSHELRTPLTAIYGSLGLLASGVAGKLPSDVHDLISIAHRSSQRLVRLINDVLDVEKIESRKMNYKMIQQALAPLVAQAIHATQPFADQYGIALECGHLDAELQVVVDADRIIQVIVNLLSNAIKFSKPGGMVKVGMMARRNTVRILVADAGCGISDDFRPRIFQRFSQADSSDQRQKGGSGLGLNICKSIVQDHQGQIDYASVAGKGSEFYFDLPVYRSDALAIVSS